VAAKSDASDRSVRFLIIRLTALGGSAKSGPRLSAMTRWEKTASRSFAWEAPPASAWTTARTSPDSDRAAPRPHEARFWLASKSPPALQT
jgi:hypothetical protein